MRDTYSSNAVQQKLRFPYSDAPEVDKKQNLYILTIGVKPQLDTSSSRNQSLSRFLQWPEWCSHCMDHCVSG